MGGRIFGEGGPLLAFSPRANSLAEFIRFVNTPQYNLGHRDITPYTGVPVCQNATCNSFLVLWVISTTPYFTTISVFVTLSYRLPLLCLCYSGFLVILWRLQFKRILLNSLCTLKKQFFRKFAKIFPSGAFGSTKSTLLAPKILGKNFAYPELTVNPGKNIFVPATQNRLFQTTFLLGVTFRFCHGRRGLCSQVLSLRQGCIRIFPSPFERPSTWYNWISTPFEGSIAGFWAEGSSIAGFSHFQARRARNCAESAVLEHFEDILKILPNQCIHYIIQLNFYYYYNFLLLQRLIVKPSPKFGSFPLLAWPYPRSRYRDHLLRGGHWMVRPQQQYFWLSLKNAMKIDFFSILTPI